MASTGGTFRGQLARAITSHRRLLAATMAAASMTVALTSLRPDPPATADVFVAKRDLTSGASLRSADIEKRALPIELVPAGAITHSSSLVGQTLSGPLRRGEPLTDVRLVGASALAGYGSGKVGAPVRIADPGVAALLHPGSIIDVLAVRTAGGLDASGPAKVVAKRVSVVALPQKTETSSATGTLVVVAATPEQASALTRSAADSRLSVTLHGS